MWVLVSVYHICLVCGVVVDWVLNGMGVVQDRRLEDVCCGSSGFSYIRVCLSPWYKSGSWNYN